MQSKAKNVTEYLAEIPEERQQAFNKLRKTILENIPKGFEECMSYGMIGYVVPHAIYPKGYHCDPKLPLPFVNIASQKNSLSGNDIFCIFEDHNQNLWIGVNAHSIVALDFMRRNPVIHINKDYSLARSGT